jgi:uncharacterized coiled-coil protein SlyX
MLTQQEKNFLLKMLENVQVSGNRKTIGRTLEQLDVLAGKIQALPVEEAEHQHDHAMPA